MLATVHADAAAAFPAVRVLATTEVTWLALGGAALGVSIVAIAIALGAVFRLRPSAAAPERDEEFFYEQQLAQFETESRYLREAAASNEAEAARLRRRLELADLLDLDAILNRTLELLVSVPGVAAAAILFRMGDDPEADEEPLVAALGLDAAEIAAHPLAWPPYRPTANRVMLTYQYPDEDAGAIRGAAVFPLSGDQPARGSVAAFWRGNQAPSESGLDLIDEISRGSAPAIERARLYRSALSQAELDALTQLYNRHYFHELLEREIARTHRYGRRLSIAVLDIDDFKALNERLGHLAADAILAEIGASIRAAVRASDIACRIGGDEFGVVLPESSSGDGEQLYHRIQIALRSTSLREAIGLSAGIAELRSEDDATTFFERADNALFQAKRLGRNQCVNGEGEPVTSDQAASYAQELRPE